MTIFIQLFAVGVLCLAFLYLGSLGLGSWQRMAWARAAHQADRDVWQARLAEAQVRLADAREQEGLVAWTGFRRFVIKRKEVENANGSICSFYLWPEDERPLPAFRPGQYLTLRIPSASSPVIRCYSLSDRPNPDYYRISVRRVEGGTASNILHDHLDEGDVIDVQAPAGDFCIDVFDPSPIVLMAGGVGITPFLSMVSTIAARTPGREMHLFYGARDTDDLVLLDELKHQAKRGRNIQIHVCLSASGEAQPGHFRERISTDLLGRCLPSLNYDFMICGPDAMMHGLRDDLKTWGVPKDRIHIEHFAPPVPEGPAPAASEVAHRIIFLRSGEELVWNPKAGNLLQFALDNGVRMPAGCRAGNCGTCRANVRGEVDYFSEPGFTGLRSSECLPCVCRPMADLEIDA
ncbi:MAG: ferredoxin-NADP reductase [Candidatus Omnitrophota bacterium]|jgi:ferredoxin-NADP reductase